jgi:hypothetical protein
VPVLLEAVRAAASHAALAHPVVWQKAQPLLKNAVAYFKEPNDFIADAAGLAGLLDDAYVAYGFIATASQRCFESTGSHLVQFPPTLLASLADIRTLLGENPSVDRLGMQATQSAADKPLQHNVMTPTSPIASRTGGLRPRA